MRNNTLVRAAVAIALLPLWVSAQQYTINTFAGGGPNHVLATTVALGNTANVVADGSGNLYFSATAMNRVFKVDSASLLTVIAGFGLAGSSGDGGFAINAGLSTPRGLALDASNNLYIADALNNKVRKVNLTTGIITTFAGNGTAGATGDGSAATGAALSNPVSVAVDGAGIVYISDQGNVKIRKVDISGIITTFAGTGIAGFAGDGTSASGAQFSTVTGITFDSNGNNLIVADSGNNRIRRISLTGANIIQTIVNQAPGTAGFTGDGNSAFNAQLNNPVDVFVDGAGILYITDQNNFRIRKVQLTAGNPGTISTIAGSANGTGNPTGDGGPATSGSLQSPQGVTFAPNGNLYIADRLNGRIRVVTGGTINTLAGNGGTVPTYGGDGAKAVDAVLNQTFGEAVDSQGNVLICDFGNSRVRKVDTNGIITTIAGTGTAGSLGDGGAATSAQLSGPAGAAIDNLGNIYIAEFNGHRIRVIRNGIISTYAGNGTGGFSGDGSQAALAKISFPIGLAVDGSNNLYIADSGNNIVRKVDFNSQIITTVVGNGPPAVAGNTGDNGPPTGPNARLSRPTAVAVNSAGTAIYIADQNNNKIRWVSNSILNTFAGNGTGAFGGDGLSANLAQLNQPTGVTLDAPNNRLYITDFNNNRIRLVNADSPNNVITTVAGSAARGFGGDGGPATSALLANPFSMTIDAAGRVYIGDQFNNRVRTLSLVPSSITATQGSGQSAQVNAAFATALQATVKDSAGNPISGATVTFTAPSGGASGTFAGGVATITAATTAAGVATAPVFTANGSTGGYNVTASVASLSTPATFSLTNISTLPANIAATQGTGQSAQVSTAFATALQATVTTVTGNPVPNVTVTFTAPSSGASGTFANGSTIATATTSAAGVAAAPAFTANGTVGTYNVTASVASLSTPATFSLTNISTLPANIAATQGTGQSAQVSTAFATALQATVTTVTGNPVPNATVTFTAPSSGASGTFANGSTIATAATSAAGVATAPAFTANGTVGTYNVTASVASQSTPATFSLTNTSSTSPANIAATQGTGQSAQVSTAFATALQATVTTVTGNPVPNATVTFTAPSSGASGTFANGSTIATAATSAAGVATAPAFTANGTAGTYNVIASAAGVNATATFALTNTIPTVCAVSVDQPTISGTAAPRVVIFNVIAAATCTWTLQSNVPWLNILLNSNGTNTANITLTGNRALALDIRRNTSSLPQQGTLTINGTVVTVNQAGSTDTTNLRYINVCFNNFLAREPGDAGVNFFLPLLNSGQLTKTQMAFNFFGAPEFNAIERFVIGLYFGILGRDPDFYGWDFHRRDLHLGIVTQDTLVTQFLATPEYAAKYGNPTNDGFVTLLFQNALGRNPTAGDVAAWSVLLGNGTLTRTQVAQAFLNSPEFQTGASARQTVFLLHATMLSRDPGTAGYTAWLGYLNSPGSTLLAAVNAFVVSPEFQSKLGPN